MTLDEWIEKNAASLKTEVATHLKALGFEDTDMLMRCIFISIRQWDDMRHQ